MTYILIILMIIAAVYFGRRELQRRAKNYTVPEPQSKRSGILYGYYGNHGDPSTAADHTSLLWVVPHWESLSKCIADMLSMQRATVLDLQHCLFWRRDGDKGLTPFEPGAQETNLRDTFQRLQTAGVLHWVRVLYPVDEPNLPETATDDFMPAAIALVRKVAADFPELQGVMVGVIYYADRPMQHVELYDVLGFDDYPAGAGVLRPGGLYDQLIKRLRPNQKTWLVPGGTYGQDPTPFINFAHSHPEVWAVVPFIWHLPAWHTEFRGIDELPVRDAYVAAGKRLLEA